ncbi:sensor histidine kinase [Salibacterium qingdaonense]|uniref:histidine kinase n=1 Tax=Salibacterium qingdaonense TaxID=266892 RepID=A0A1I4LP19_9BACI|nr:ATP-binding protein [Salibacterium qingdaonense]SFL92651.1 Signal transduction histidine kinase [Salibacterium qingdaonense]
MSIKNRLIISHFIVIGLSVFALILILLFITRQYYFNNLEQNVKEEAEEAAAIYSSQFSTAAIENQVHEFISGVQNNSSLQLQVVNENGVLLKDSVEKDRTANLSDYPDVDSALSGRSSSWMGKRSGREESIIAASVPLKAGNETAGAVRYTTSLDKANDSLFIISGILLGSGVAVTGLSVLVSILLSHSIVQPIRKLTTSTEKMAEGYLSERVSTKNKDEIGQLAGSLNFMASELQRQETLKSRFISSVSHELRTPLTSIQGWAVLLRNTSEMDQENVQEGLQLIDEETERLSVMVEELLDFSKMEAGDLVLQQEWFDVKELFAELERQLMARGNRMNIDIQFKSDVMDLHADRNRVKQVLLNIVDNAIKYSPQNGTVTVRSERREKEVLMVITDDGEGIAEKDLPHIQERAYQGFNHKSGSGLGLAISTEIINRHHGRMDITSEWGIGTTVTLSFPS